MVECGKCRTWFHADCINKSESQLKSILIYFCQSCLSMHKNLKIITKDYSKEHTKALFKSHNILTIYNLYPYHVLLELYKILKFRMPYCMYELLNMTQCNGRGLSIVTPKVTLSSQKRTFIYNAVILWNKMYKSIIRPFTIKLHDMHRLRCDSYNPEVSYYDLSTTVSTFKSKVKDLLYKTQILGDINWSPINNLCVTDSWSRSFSG